jgi:hypothetical protein
MTFVVVDTAAKQPLSADQSLAHTA